MPNSKESQIKRYNSTADQYEKKGKREWAYAKNDMGSEHYAKSRDAFTRAKRNRDKAKAMENED